MNMKGLMAGMVLAILILTATGSALDAPFYSAFSVVYGQVTDGGAGVNGAHVSLAANGVTLTTVTMTNNRGENGFYIFELANIPGVEDTTPLTLSVTAGTKTATTTITRGGNALQRVDLVPQTPVLTTITVTPAIAALVVGGTQTFTATTLDQSGNPIAVAVTWSSSNTGVGTINATGVFTAVAAGTTTVNATNGNIVGSASVTVTAPLPPTPVPTTPVPTTPVPTTPVPTTPVPTTPVPTTPVPTTPVPTTPAPTATPAIEPSGAGSTSGGGGGGGGGVTTSEPYENIEKSERYEKSLIAGTPVTYNFIALEHGIEQIIVTGNENENDIALRVEMLKGTAKVVTAAPPGIVYKNLNIWAGTKRIKKAVIKLKVENSWMQSNNFAGGDVKLFKWDGSKWIQLETGETGKDSTYTHFEAATDTFSHFAVIGMKGETPVPAATPEVKITQPEATPGVTLASPEAAPPINLAVLTGVIILIAVIVLLYIRRR